MPTAHEQWNPLEIQDQAPVNTRVDTEFRKWVERNMTVLKMMFTNYTLNTQPFSGTFTTQTGAIVLVENGIVISVTP